MEREGNKCQATKENEKGVIEKETVQKAGGKGKQKRAKACRKYFQFDSFMLGGMR
jgi:hypothetical protein